MIAESWRSRWDYIIPFLALPADLRRIVYTTNSIENLNRQIRKAIKTRGHFPDEQAATKLIYLAIQKRPPRLENPLPLDHRPPSPQDPLRRPTPRLTTITPTSHTEGRTVSRRRRRQADHRRLEPLPGHGHRRQRQTPQDDRLGVRSRRRRRRDPTGLCRSARRRKGHQRDRVLASRGHLVCQPRRDHRARAHRQRLRLPIHHPRTRLPRTRHPPPPNPAAAPTDQRQSRTLHPHHARRLGLQRATYGSSAERRTALDGWLQHYNHHRPHRSLSRQPPITRLNNLAGSYI